MDELTAIKNRFEIYKWSGKKKQYLPYYETRISAGFPSPADDYAEKKIDLNEKLVKHPEATFFVKVDGDSMIDCGICSGDILLVDRAVEARDGKIIVAVLNGEFTVKRLKTKNQKYYLVPENQRYRIIEITEEDDFEIWGVVTSVIREMK